MMKHMYYDEATRAVIDGHYTDDGDHWRISRIHVPAVYRGCGAGSALMKRMLIDADAEQLRLILEPVPYDGGDALPALIRFYERHGFQLKEDGTMFRLPNTQHTGEDT